MPNIKSAAKRMRQNAKRRAENRSKRSAMRTAMKKLNAMIDAGEGAQAAAELPRTLSVIGKMAQKGLIHKNKAARHASSFTRKVSALSQPNPAAESDQPGA